MVYRYSPVQTEAVRKIAGITHKFSPKPSIISLIKVDVVVIQTYKKTRHKQRRQELYRRTNRPRAKFRFEQESSCIFFSLLSVFRVRSIVEVVLLLNFLTAPKLSRPA
jgi:hypothetical protein